MHFGLLTVNPVNPCQLSSINYQLSTANKRCLSLVIIEDQGEASFKTGKSHHIWLNPAKNYELRAEKL